MKTTFDKNVMAVDGALKTGHEFDFMDAMQELVEKHPHNAICDLTRVPFMNAACLGAMCTVVKRPDISISFRIKRGSDIEHLLDITRLLDVFTIEWVE